MDKFWNIIWQIYGIVKNNNRKILEYDWLRPNLHHINYTVGYIDMVECLLYGIAEYYGAVYQCDDIL